MTKISSYLLPSINLLFINLSHWRWTRLSCEGKGSVLTRALTHNIYFGLLKVRVLRNHSVNIIQRAFRY